jgi:hypothetical protein
MLGNSLDFPTTLLIMGLFIFLNAYFYIFIASYLWSIVSPAVTIISIVISLIAFYNLLTVSFTDPGK